MKSILLDRCVTIPSIYNIPVYVTFNIFVYNQTTIVLFQGRNENFVSKKVFVFSEKKRKKVKKYKRKEFELF